MSIQIDGKTFRNLEEQVQYLSDLHEAGKALASWGIKVIGQVETADELPQNYTGEYGDAYAVGTEPPYDFYIWTRASIEYGDAYWFNFGQISIIGPQGPQGPQGEPGRAGTSSTWYTGQSAPLKLYFYKSGDMYLNTTNGQVYRYNGTEWVLAANIMGPQGIQGIRGQTGPQGEQGPQGPKGNTGDVGGFINIAGILQSEDQLPTPASLGNLTIAYLIEHTGGTDQANDHYDLYIQVGSTSAEATWNNVGPFNAATLVTVNGVGQNVWNADTKIDDVRINDVSQVTNGVANIPIASDNTIGVSRPASGLGITLLTGGNLGRLAINAAGYDMIKARTAQEKPYHNYSSNSCRPIVPANLDYAVKAGLVKNNDILTNTDTWNEDEKAAARATLGISGGTQFYKHTCKFNKNQGDNFYDFSVVEAVLPVNTNFGESQQLIDTAFGYGLQGMMTGYTATYYSEFDYVKKASEVFNLRKMYDQENGQDLPFCSTQGQDRIFANTVILYTALGGMGEAFEYTVTPL